MIKNYLWIVPFLCFLGGYLTVHFFFSVNEIITPALVGNNVYNTLVTLSNYKLNPRILGEKEDADLPNGTIISQAPAAGQKIKPNQSIHLLISKRPPTLYAPDLLNKKLSTIKKELQQWDIHTQIYAIPNTYPQQKCFAQFPAPNNSLKHNSLIVYISAGNRAPIIWPNFTGLLVIDVLAFLQAHNLYPQIIHHTERNQSHVCKNCIVLHQHPRAGSLITLDPQKALRVQLRVH